MSSKGRRIFGLDTAVISAFAKNEVGMLLEDLICQGKVDTSWDVDDRRSGNST